jgi:hypothetical protein
MVISDICYANVFSWLLFLTQTRRFDRKPGDTRQA